MKVLIIGATGGTGRILLEKAVEQGHEVTALARNPSAVAPRDYRPRVLRGNVLDPDAVEAAVAGQDAVLSALGTRSTKPSHFILPAGVLFHLRKPHTDPAISKMSAHQ